MLLSDDKCKNSTRQRAFTFLAELFADHHPLVAPALATSSSLLGTLVATARMHAGMCFRDSCVSLCLCLGSAGSVDGASLPGLEQGALGG